MNYFASQLMAQVEEAAEAATNFRGFDEMADEDEYIHSEGLNVSSPQQFQEKEEEADGENESFPQEETQNHTATEPTWSLLDRPPSGLASMVSPSAVAASAAVSGAASEGATNGNDRGRSLSRNGGESTISSSPVSSITPPRHRQRERQPPAPKQQQQTNNYFYQPGSNKTTTTTTTTTTSMPLLSVVADALNGRDLMSESGRQRQQSSFSGYDSDNEESTLNTNANDNDNQHRYGGAGSSCSSSSSSSSSGSSSSSDESDDEDDAILSQIRQSSSHREAKHHRGKKHSNRKRKKRSKTKKTGGRHAPIPGSASAAEFSQRQQNQYALEIDNSNNYAAPGAGSAGAGPLSNLKTWINPFQQQSSGLPTTASTSNVKKGPLSRRSDFPPLWQQLDENTNGQGKEEFQLSAGSTSVLRGNHEMEILAQTNYEQSQQQQQLEVSSLIPALVKLIRKSPRESFIVFTMLLAIFVFFFTRRLSNENDVQ